MVNSFSYQVLCTLRILRYDIIIINAYNQSFLLTICSSCSFLGLVLSWHWCFVSVFIIVVSTCYIHIHEQDLDLQSLGFVLSFAGCFGSLRLDGLVIIIKHVHYCVNCIVLRVYEIMYF